MQAGAHDATLNLTEAILSGLNQLNYVLNVTQQNCDLSSSFSLSRNETNCHRNISPPQRVP